MRTEPVKYFSGAFFDAWVPARAMESETVAAAEAMFISLRGCSARGQTCARRREAQAVTLRYYNCNTQMVRGV
jgi:hypothetical protein